MMNSEKTEKTIWSLPPNQVIGVVNVWSDKAQQSLSRLNLTVPVAGAWASRFG
jgi:hypothetical protein